MTPLYTNRNSKIKSNLAYLAGLIGADGSLETKKPFITIASADRQFLEKQVAPLIVNVTRRRIRVFMDRSANVYKLRMYDRKLWSSLVKRYRIPCGAKSRIVRPPLMLTNDERLQYLQGWLDGEGWIEILRVRAKKLNRYPRIGFKVRSKSIRNWIRRTLKERGVPVRTYDRVDESFGIWINGTRASELFLRNVGFGYAPKNAALRKLIEKCRGNVSAKIRTGFR